MRLGGCPLCVNCIVTGECTLDHRLGRRTTERSPGTVKDISLSYCAASTPGGKEGETSRKGKPSTLGQRSLRCLATPNPTPISWVRLASSYSSELQSPPQPRPWYLGHGLSGRIATDGASPLSLAVQLPLRHLDHPVHHLEAGGRGEVGREYKSQGWGPKDSYKASLRQSPETRVLQRQSFSQSPFCPQGFQPSPHPTPTSTPNLLLPDPPPSLPPLRESTSSPPPPSQVSP